MRRRMEWIPLWENQRMTSKTVANNRYIGKEVPDEIALPLMLERLLSRRHFAESGCHEYTGQIHPLGYGMVTFKGKPIKVHRLFWICLHGPIRPWPLDVVLHSCDNRKCINPDHLSLGTQQENIRDCVHKGRQASRRKTHCPRGHEYAKHAAYRESPSFIQQATPWRVCKMCSLIRTRKKAGWPEHLWEIPAQPHGQRKSFTDAKESK